jgi:intergrase/recombinase
MSIKPEYEELSHRILSHLEIAKNEQEKREIKIAWRAYIVALNEWEVISMEQFSKLSKLLLPALENDPTVTVAVGVPDEDDEE